MKSFLKKCNKKINKLFTIAVGVFMFKYGCQKSSILQNQDHLGVSTIDHFEKIDQDSQNFQNLNSSFEQSSSNSVKVRTGSGVVIMVKNSSTTSSVAGQALRLTFNTGFTRQSPFNTPKASPRSFNVPKFPKFTPSIRVPHQLVQGAPSTGARPNTQLDARRKSIQNSTPKHSKGSLTPGKGAPKPNGSSVEFEVGNSKKIQNQKKKEISHNFFEKKKKNQDNQCKLTEQPLETREFSEKFETNAVKKLAQKSLKNPRVSQEYERIKNQIQQGTHPKQIGGKTAYVGSDIVLIKWCYLMKVDGDKVYGLGLTDRSDFKKVRVFRDSMNELYDLTLQYHDKN